MESDTKYQMFNLIGKEFTFDVDVSKLPCGLNGALYFVEMAADGGINKGNNKAGAKYGTGYCDSQCPHDIKFINGVANVEGWNPSDNDSNAGQGKMGACCPEMDIWEANSISTAYTPHPCKGTGLQECTDDVSCGDGDNRYGGICDKDGCDFNSYRMGVRDFYGPGMTLDTTKKMTVVTQFIGSGSSLSEIKRFYIQGGTVFKNSDSAIEGVSGNSITEKYCDQQKTAFGDTSSFKTLGGLNEMVPRLLAATSSSCPSGTTMRSTCSGSTLPTPPMPTQRSLVSPVVPALPTLASPRTLRPTRPARLSSSPTSSLVPLAPPLPSPHKRSMRFLVNFGEGPTALGCKSGWISFDRPLALLQICIYLWWI